MQSANDGRLRTYRAAPCVTLADVGAGGALAGATAAVAVPGKTWKVFGNFVVGNVTLAAHFTALRDIAAETRQALNTNDWHELARQMSREWDTRQALAPGVTTPAIDQILSASRAAGAMSGKVCGAGGGGCVCLLIDPDRRDDVYRSLVDSKAQVLECRIDTDGLRVDATED